MGCPEFQRNTTDRQLGRNRGRTLSQELRAIVRESETDEAIRESKIPWSRDTIDLDRINTERRLKGLKPLAPDTPASERRTSEIPSNIFPRRRRSDPSSIRASSIYPESEVSMPHDEKRYRGDEVQKRHPGDEVDWSRLDDFSFIPNPDKERKDEFMF